PMSRALVLACLLLASCESVGASFFALGTFEREFPASLDPVEIPGFDLDALLTPSNVALLAAALGYDVASLVEAGADFTDLQSVVAASEALGDPLARHDATIRALLASIATSYVNDLLTREDAGLFVEIGLGPLFE